MVMDLNTGNLTKMTREINERIQKERKKALIGGCLIALDDSVFG